MTCRKLALALVVALVPSLAHAQASRVGPGIQAVPRASAPGKFAANGSLWINSGDSNKWWYTTPGGASAPVSSGGGSSTLAADYATGASQTDSTILLDSTRLGVRIRDNATPITGALFSVQSSGGGSTWFDIGVSPAAVRFGLNLTPFVDTGNTVGTTALRFLSVSTLAVDSGGSSLSLQANGNTRITVTDTGSITVKSGMADGASAIAAIIDTTTAWSNTSSKILSLRTNGVEKVWFGPANAGLPTNYNINGTDISITGNTNSVQIGSTVGGGIGVSNSDVTPFVDNQMQFGGAGNRLLKLVTSYWYGQKQGALLTAAPTITPTAGLHHVTGGTTIDNIAITNVPAPGTNVMNCTLIVFADGGTITWSSLGNIKAAGTLAQDKAMRFTWDATNSKWYAEQFLLLPFVGIGLIRRRRRENDNVTAEALRRLVA